MSACIVPVRPLLRLPLVTLYVTERCNSRCVTCDYWRHGRGDMDLGWVERLLPSLVQLRTQTVLLSGGEPLLNPAWAEIASLLKSQGLEVWLLTSGLSLAKHACRAAELFSTITVSLDGTNRRTYATIRGLDAFDKVCEGILESTIRGVPTDVRVTLQRANYRELSAFVDLARSLGARQISFLAVDTANPHAFGRNGAPHFDPTLNAEDLPVFEKYLDSLESDRAEDFRTGFIAESPKKLRRILHYFRALRGLGPYPPVRCNAPEFSAVIGAAGHVQPCFFIAGPTDAQVPGGEEPSLNDLVTTLNNESSVALRTAIHEGMRHECKTCVCSIWRDPGSFAAAPRVVSARETAA